ncbi:MAG: hypothetical protein H8E48_12510 [Chloroflexi bacterium]|nr:hypothetical protein [Chloroflexota bacterium]
MTKLRLRALISRVPSPHTPELGEVGSKNWSGRNWAVVALVGILAIVGLEGYALSLGIDGTALRAALTSIGIIGGAGFSRVLK